MSYKAGSCRCTVKMFKKMTCFCLHALGVHSSHSVAFPEPRTTDPFDLVTSVRKFYEGTHIPMDVLKSVMPV